MVQTYIPKFCNYW